MKKILTSTIRRRVFTGALTSLATVAISPLITIQSALASNSYTVNLGCIAGSKLNVSLKTIVKSLPSFSDVENIICVGFSSPVYGAARITNYSMSDLKIEYSPNRDFNGDDEIKFYCFNGSESVSFLLQINVEDENETWSGDKSFLPWHSGGFSDLGSLEALRLNAATSRTRELDMAQIFADHGSWDRWSTSATSFASTASFHSWMTSRGCPAMNVAIRVFSASNQATSVIQSSIPSSWPTRGNLSASAWVSPRLPVGYQASGLTDAQKRAQAMDVWQHAADGHFDHLWDAGLKAMRTNYLVRYGLSDRTVILRPFWESNGAFVYGTNHAIYAASIACASATADTTVIKAAMRRFCDVARTAWPGAMLHYCPLPGGATGSIPITDFIEPEVWDILGPDYYDLGLQKGPPYGDGTFEDRWTQQTNATGPGGGPKGIGRWASYVRGTGRRFGIGEWGVWPLGDSNFGGGDNPTFVRRMFQLFEANADIMAYEVYFNSASAGHRLAASGSGYPNASAAYREMWSAWT